MDPLCFQEEPQLWDFPPSLIFRRLDSFLHRLKTIEVTAQHFGAWHQALVGSLCPGDAGVVP